MRTRAYNGLGWGTVFFTAIMVATGIYAKCILRDIQLQSDNDALTKAVYWEALAAKEPRFAASVVARVVTNRAEANRSYWGRGDIHDVVFARKTVNGRTVCQFTFTCDPLKRNARIGTSPLWQEARRIATRELEGKAVIPAAFANATGYNNPGPSAPRNVCHAKLALVFLGKVEEGSKHEFYREPADLNDFAERPLRRDVPECNPKGALARHATPLSRSG